MKTKGKAGDSILKNRKGQNIVEFALIVPVLLLLVFGIAEFGRAWMTRNIMTSAAREAARLAAVPAPAGGTDLAYNRAIEVLDSAGITGASVSVNDGGPFGPMTVIVNYDFPVVIVGFLPGLNSRTLSLTSSTTMRREY